MLAFSWLAVPMNRHNLPGCESGHLRTHIDVKVIDQWPARCLPDGQALLGTLRDFRFYVDPKWPVRLDEYGAVMFVYQSDLAEQVATLGRVYVIPLSALRCKAGAVVSTATIAVCEAPQM
jgi:hypothetical protein